MAFDPLLGLPPEEALSACEEEIREIFSAGAIQPQIAEELLTDVLLASLHKSKSLSIRPAFLLYGVRSGVKRLGRGDDNDRSRRSRSQVFHFSEPLPPKTESNHSSLIPVSDPSRTIIEVSSAISLNLLARLQEEPEALRRLEPRQFEALIAELLARHGWEVTLTPRSGDGGYDVFGVCKDISGVTNAWLIECKRYRKDRKVGVEIVRALWGVASLMRGVNAMVATTSDFTRGAKEFKASAYNMDLRNYSAVLDWINEYKPRSEGKFYIKEDRLVVPGEG